MKPFLAILGREIAERKLLFVGAAFASLFPVVMPWLPGLSDQNPAELRGGMALGLALITSSLLALVLGTTVIGRDLSERRIGFYFARPVPGWAIWAGKMLSAAFLSLGMGALILLVSFFAGGRVDSTGYWGSMNAFMGMSTLVLFSLAVPGILMLVVLGHAVSIMVRSRSPWLGADLVAFAVVVATFWTRSRSLEQEGAFAILAWGEICFATIAFSAVTFAGLVQVVGGRTDLRRGHRLLSLTLWTVLGAATLGHAAYVHWALGVTPEDLVSIKGVQPAPAGSWIGIAGQARGRGGYTPSFLLDTASGRSIKLPGGLAHSWSPPLFSLDGSHAYWFEMTGEKAGQLLTIDLRSPNPGLRQTREAYSGSGEFGFEPSPSGRRIAILDRGRLTVESLDAGRMLASVPMAGLPGVFFLGEDRVRILKTSHDDEPGMPEVWRLITLDLDVAKNRLRPVSRIEIPGDWWSWVLSLDGRWAILRQRHSQVSRIADLETGRTVTVPSEESVLRFLDDGRLIRLQWSEAQNVVLSLLDRDGAERLRVPLPGARFQIGSSVSPDLLVVATAERGYGQKIGNWTTWLLDLRTGGLQKVGSGMLPAIGDARTGSPGAHLVYQASGGLAFFDPRTGRLRTILHDKPFEAGLWLARPPSTRSQYR